MGRVTFRLAKAVGYAADIAPSLFTGPQLETLIMKAGLSRFQPPPRGGAQRYGKTELVASTTHGAVTAAHKGNSDAADGLKEFVLLVAMRSTGEDLGGVVEAVRSAGFDLLPVNGKMRLLPLDEPASPLSRAVTALEVDLDQLGLTTAVTHYRQAIDSLVDGRAEAANGQMRSMLEEVIIQVAVANGYTRTRQGEGGKAITHLVNMPSLLPLNDGGEYIRGLWNITHTNGPHPGTSPAGEAHFRVQAMTSAARYLIDRFMSPRGSR
jgi:hypothetical protein